MTGDGYLIEVPSSRKDVPKVSTSHDVSTRHCCSLTVLSCCAALPSPDVFVAQAWTHGGTHSVRPVTFFMLVCASGRFCLPLRQCIRRTLNLSSGQHISIDNVSDVFSRSGAVCGEQDWQKVSSTKAVNRYSRHCPPTPATELIVIIGLEPRLLSQHHMTLVASYVAQVLSSRSACRSDAAPHLQGAPRSSLHHRVATVSGADPRL